MDESHRRLTAMVRGRVQGVSFRYYTQYEARKLGLTGWVANQRDGSVQVVAEGPLAELQLLVRFLERGSPAARVDSIDIDWSAPKFIYEGFQIRWA